MNFTQNFTNEATATALLLSFSYFEKNAHTHSKALTQMPQRQKPYFSAYSKIEIKRQVWLLCVRLRYAAIVRNEMKKRANFFIENN